MNAEGATHEYGFKATNRRDATRQAREWVARTEWATSLVGVYRPIEKSRRLLVVAGVTFATAGTTIAAAMIVELSVEGLL